VSASPGAGPAWRRWTSAVALVLATILFPVGLFASWASSVVYDSSTFADRSVSMLNDAAVRREVAAQLTEQLARSGNQAAVNFRPAFQLAVEAAIDTDTFRSIFRTAVLRTHSGILASQESGSEGVALDLSDTVSIIVANLSLPSSAAQGQASSSAGLGDSLADVTTRLSDLHVWDLQSYVDLLAGIGVLGGLVLSAAAVALSLDRRRTLRRLGWCVLGGGLVLAALVPAAQWIAGARVSDGPLSSAVSAGLGEVMADLRTLGLWVAAYGLLLVAAARRQTAPRPTPARVWRRFLAWCDRMRATTAGTVVLGLGALVLGITVVSNAATATALVVAIAGVWLSYFGITELTRLARLSPSIVGADAAGASPVDRRRRAVALTGIVVVLALVIGVAGFAVTRRAATTAAAAGVPECNGEADLCDVPLNAAMFAGSHNAMSSALYPGWLFAEQTSTLRGQLDAGIRALLIDSHYGIPSAARLPGSETTVVLSDRAAELATPPGEDVDPAIAQRAQQVAANAPPAADAQRDLYLCHNFCEMGAVSFVAQMTVVRQWLETHPDQVVMMVIEDHTTPADTVAALEAAGLDQRAWTLDPDRPIPTFGDLITSGRNLVVFAENGGPDAPDWYQRAYTWFQETPYAWGSVDEMTCAPNRGSPTNPFMLVNHWVGFQPPDPGRAGSEVNSGDVLERRIDDCMGKRDVVPNIVAVDFAERGALVATVERFNSDIQSALDRTRASTRRATPDTPGAAAAPGTTLPAAEPSGSAVGGSTEVTSLTGGNPAAFCAAAGPFVQTMAAWALADLAKPAQATGLPALAFGPAVLRQSDGIVSSAPQEIERQLAPAVAMATASVDALRATGFDDAAVDRMASTAVDELSGTNPDPGVLTQQLIALLDERLGSGGTTALARSFGAANPIGAEVFDLGSVSDEVASASGYGCLIGTGG
jgi:hypothetical protein